MDKESKDEGYYWQRINYFTDNPVARVVRWHLEIQQKEGTIRNLTLTPKANKTWVTYEWSRHLEARTSEHTGIIKSIVLE